MPSASFMSKLSLQHLDNSLLSGSLRTLFRGSQTQYRVARELYGSILLYTRIGFSGPIEVSVLGGPLYR